MLSRLIAASLPILPRALVRGVAQRYVAGETRGDALETTRKLNSAGARVTLALLGEHVEEVEETRRVVDHCKGLLRQLADSDVDASLSIKPTHIGLDIDEDLCFEHLRELVDCAADLGNFVRIDMENRHTTDATLRMYRRLRAEYDNVGVVLQAYLRRTLDDIDQLPSGADVRICKGIYVEPAEVAYQRYERIREAFMEAFERLLDRQVNTRIATHDEVLVARCEAVLTERETPREAYEFQMLLGVREPMRDQILRRHPLRVYVPFGPDWYDYSVRRLRENPKIAGHVLRALVRGR